MLKLCSLDLWISLFDVVIAGVLRREEVDCFDVSVSLVVKWL